MKFKLLLLTISLTSFSLSVFAISTADSVGVENHDGKKVILHKLAPKDNYYSIGRRYNISPQIIMNFNSDAKMTIGNIIKVPTDRPYTESAHTVKTTSINKNNKPVVQKPVNKQTDTPHQTKPVNNDGKTTQYKVSAGETLYAIAKRFNTTVENIVKLNGLKSHSVSSGQILLIKSNNVQSVITPPTPTIPVKDTVVKRDSTAPAPVPDSGHHINASRFGLHEKDEKGVATWMDDDDNLDPNKMLVLHRTAPIGTVIKITNIMTNRTTFAKVVGRFTDTEQTKDVVIVLTKNVAQALGALDKRFQVNLSYGVYNE